MEERKEIRTAEELEFAIFCIEHVAQKLNVSPELVYCALAESSNILNQYIVPEYGTLHTQGKDYIVSEIIEVMQERGVAV